MNLPWRKQRTSLGRWIDNRGITQDWLVGKTGLNKSSISDLCNDEDYVPRNATRTKIIKALRQVDPNVSASDFW